MAGCLLTKMFSDVMSGARDDRPWLDAYRERVVGKPNSGAQRVIVDIRCGCLDTRLGLSN